MIFDVAYLLKSNDFYVGSEDKLIFSINFLVAIRKLELQANACIVFLLDDAA